MAKLLVHKLFIKPNKNACFTSQVHVIVREAAINEGRVSVAEGFAHMQLQYAKMYLSLFLAIFVQHTFRQSILKQL